MQDVPKAGAPARLVTLKFKLQPDSKRWLDEAAVQVNQVWNYCNETGLKAAQPYLRKGRWLTGFDLCKLTSGATKYFSHIGADTIQRVCTEYAQKRREKKRVKLKWRKSFGSHASRGWVPFKAASLRRHGKYIRFCGKAFRFFEAKRFAELKRWQQGCFSRDAMGDWYLCLPVDRVDETQAPVLREVGVDLGLKDTAITSEGERLAPGEYYRDLEVKIARAQRQGHLRQVKRLFRKAKNRRAHALHEFSRSLVNRYQTIIVGDVSSQKLVKTRMAKAVLDSGWGKLKTQLLYKGEYAGRCVRIVNERNTSRTCSSCGALTGPSGLDGLRIREWMCDGCGMTHDRDVNAARNILLVGRTRPSDVGNEPRV